MFRTGCIASERRAPVGDENRGEGPKSAGKRSEGIGGTWIREGGR